MKVRGLDNREYAWNLTGLQVNADDLRPRSSLHKAARELLNELYPTSPVLEEVPLPGSGQLKADFYLSRQKLMVEVHGEQHYKFNKHFHGTKANFIDACKRDANKQEWCQINNIKLVVLPHWEDVDGWRTRIRER
jgi:hypothetical protein